MHVASARICLRIAGAASLKDKRRVRQGIVERVRRNFGASVAEVGSQDSHKELEIGVAVVGASRLAAERHLDGVIRYVGENTAAELAAVEIFD